MKREIRYALLFLLLLGCAAEQQGPRTLSLALETAPNKLDPAFVVDVSEGRLVSMLFQGLVRFNPAGDLVPDAARSWELSDGGRRYTFHLDPRATFSNGQRLRSRDVIASFRRVLDPDTASPRRWVFDRVNGAAGFSNGTAGDVTGLRAPNDSTVVILLDEPFQPFIMLLGMPNAAILPADSPGEPGKRLVGSGAWRLAEWKRGDRLLLLPNSFHHRHSRTLDSIEFRIIPEPFTRIAEFESGALDILHVPAAEVGRFKNGEEYRGRLQQVTELRIAYIGLNNRHRLLGDLRVRRALNMAIDVERMITVLLQGQGERAAGAVPPALAGHVRRDPYPYDPVEARRLLREAGVPEGFAIDLWQRDSPEGNLLCEAIQGYLLQVGVTARLVKREWSAFKEAVSKGKVDAFFLDWYGDYPDAENFLFPLFHSGNMGGGGNRAFFSDPRVDSLILAAQRTIDPAVRIDLYARTDSLVFESAPWVFLYFPRSLYALSPGLRGYEAPVIYLGEEYETVWRSNPGSLNG